jgi:prophage antirepressor-like protein
MEDNLIIHTSKNRNITDIEVIFDDEHPHFTYTSLCKAIDYLHHTNFADTIENSRHIEMMIFLYKKYPGMKDMLNGVYTYYDVYKILEKYELKKELWKII